MPSCSIPSSLRLPLVNGRKKQAKHALRGISAAGVVVELVGYACTHVAVGSTLPLCRYGKPMLLSVALVAFTWPWNPTYRNVMMKAIRYDQAIIDYRICSFPIRLLTQITDALRRQAQPGRFPARLWAEMETQGCAYVHQAEDLVYAMDDRTHGFRLRELANLAGYPVHGMYKRPRFKNAGAFSLEMVEVTNIVGFCIFLEQLGFGVDPGPMVDRLYAQIEAKNYLTRAQSDIYCYNVIRHKEKLTLQAAELVDAQPIQHEWRGASGHLYQCLVRGNQVTSLTIAGPRWRAPRHIDLTCSVCGTRYTKGDPESALNHRTTHAKTFRLLEPRPSKPMRERLQHGLAGERVDVNSPIWMHQEVACRALRFKRDFGYDFLQWPSVTTRNLLDPRWVRYLFADADGVIDGACAFYCDKGEWRLDWTWVRPERRRHGLRASRWPYFLSEFGDFWIEHPISDQMKAFVARHGSQGQLRRIHERYPHGSPINNPD